jgi:hypothetical protein
MIVSTAKGGLFAGLLGLPFKGLIISELIHVYS